MPHRRRQKIGAFVEIQKGATIGARCKSSSHTCVCEGVAIEDEVFVGHGVMFIKDRHLRATAGGRLQTDADWQVDPSHITLLNKDLLRLLFVLEGCRSRPDLEERMDWGRKGRVLVLEEL